MSAGPLSRTMISSVKRNSVSSQCRCLVWLCILAHPTSLDWLGTTSNGSIRLFVSIISVRRSSGRCRCSLVSRVSLSKQPVGSVWLVLSKTTSIGQAIRRSTCMTMRSTRSSMCSCLKWSRNETGLTRASSFLSDQAHALGGFGQSWIASVFILASKEAPFVWQRLQQLSIVACRSMSCSARAGGVVGRCSTTSTTGLNSMLWLLRSAVLRWPNRSFKSQHGVLLPKP